MLADLDVHEGFVDRALARLAGLAERRNRALSIADQPDDRVDDQVDLQAELIERRGHRIDQERHVVVDDLDDGMGRLPALFLGLRAVDPDLGDPERPGLAVAPQGQGGAIEVVRFLAQDVVRRHVGIELAQEAFRGFDAGRLQALAQAPGNPVDQVVLELFRLDNHDPVPPAGSRPTRADRGRSDRRRRTDRPRESALPSVGDRIHRIDRTRIVGSIDPDPA